jgi:hypothetical protein
MSESPKREPVQVEAFDLSGASPPVPDAEAGRTAYAIRLLVAKIDRLTEARNPWSEEDDADRVMRRDFEMKREAAIRKAERELWALKRRGAPVAGPTPGGDEG